MKRIIISLMLVVVLLSGCGIYNKKILDTSYQFNYAMIRLPNGEVIETEIKSWSDGDEGDIGWIQIWTKDNYYYTALENVVLSNKKIERQ